MKDAEVIELINKMSSCLEGNIFESESADSTIKLWIDKLVFFDNETAKIAADNIIQRSPFFPTLNEFIDSYKSIPIKKVRTTCLICNDNGFLLHTRNNELNKKSQALYGADSKIEIVSHCTCEKGKDYMAGSQSILAYYSAGEIENIKAKNIFAGNVTKKFVIDYNKLIQKVHETMEV